VDDRFIELFIKELSDEISPEELIELRSFLNKDDIYKTQYKSLQMYWGNKDARYADNTSSFQKVKNKILKYQDDTAPEVIESNPSARFGLFTFWRSVAAILIISACTYLFYLKYARAELNNAIVSLQEKKTPRRVKSIIVLSDGTRITLNSESSLKYPSAFTGKTREVYLSGEAFFDVHKDHEHPFIIHTGKMDVRVLGTEFNVRSYPGEALSETSLIRGSIVVTLADRPSDRIILKPKEKLIVKNNNFKISAADLKNTQSADNNISTQYTLTSLTYLNNKSDTTSIEASWVQNKLVVQNEEFKDLADKMQRWYGVNIYFNDDELKKIRFTASFEKENIIQALDALRLTENFHYKIDKSNIYIY
jgi:transmembrane sensor